MSVSPSDFFQRLADSGLLSPAEIERHLRRIEDNDDPDAARQAAEELINENVLTRFQAAVLLGTETMPLAVGDYLILEELGQGGMGRVFRARHQQMGRDVALKFLSKGLLSDPQAERRFDREVKLLAHLSHPNIVVAHDCREDSGVKYLVTEFVDGSNLAKMVRTGGPFSPQQAVEVVRQVAKGLQYAHSQNVIHRDIKPSNLLIDRQNTIKILDLGLARIAAPPRTGGEDETDLTASGTVIGTVNYIAPEQILDMSAVDQRADIYSLGCTLHFMLTGAPPVPDTSRAQRLKWHLEGERKSLRTKCNHVPPELDAVYLKMVAREPDDRYRSAAQLLDALDSVPSVSDESADLPPTLEWRDGRSDDATTRRETTEADTRERMSPTTRRFMIGAIVVLMMIALFAGIRMLPKDGNGHGGVAGGTSGKTSEQKSRPSKSRGKEVAGNGKKVDWHNQQSFENSVGMKFIRVPAGKFQMGSPQEEIGAQENEFPLHDVSFEHPFRIGRHEVTQEQYERVMGHNPSRFAFTAEDKPARNYPVDTISCDDAVEFCRKLSEREEEKAAGRIYRLPTEAEWEYACRAGSKAPFSFGASLSSEQANFDGTRPYGDAKVGINRTHTMAVGSYPANAFGLHDMHGNVMEWCADPYRSYPNSQSRTTRDPKNRVLRGGALQMSGADCRCGVRFAQLPGTHSFHFGFRVICEQRRP